MVGDRPSQGRRPAPSARPLSSLGPHLGGMEKARPQELCRGGLPMEGDGIVSPSSHVKVLTPTTSDRDCIWKQVAAGVIT